MESNEMGVSLIVEEAMTSSPATVSRDALVVEAARCMLSEDVGSLPVVEGEDLLGVIIDRDVVLQVVAKDRDPKQISKGE